MEPGSDASESDGFEMEHNPSVGTFLQILAGVEENKIDFVEIDGDEFVTAGLPESTCSIWLKKIFEAMKNNTSVEGLRLNGKLHRTTHGVN